MEHKAPKTKFQILTESLQKARIDEKELEESKVKRKSLASRSKRRKFQIRNPVALRKYYDSYGNYISPGVRLQTRKEAYILVVFDEPFRERESGRNDTLHGYRLKVTGKHVQVISERMVSRANRARAISAVTVSEEYNLLAIKNEGKAWDMYEMTTGICVVQDAQSPMAGAGKFQSMIHKNESDRKLDPSIPKYLDVLVANGFVDEFPELTKEEYIEKRAKEKLDKHEIHATAHSIRKEMYRTGLGGTSLNPHEPREV